MKNNLWKTEHQMKQEQTTLEQNAENSRERKWAIRLFAVLLACMSVAFVIHAIGQVMLIAHIYP